MLVDTLLLLFLIPLSFIINALAHDLGHAVAGKLECLTKPFDGLESNEGAGELGKGEVDVVTSFVTHPQAAEAVEPGTNLPYH